MNLFRRVLRLNSSFWTEDRSLTALLVYLLIVIFVLPPLTLSRGSEIVNAVFFSMVLVSGVFAANEHGHVRLLILILAAIAIVVHWLNLSSLPLQEADNIFSMLSLGTLASVVLYHVFKEGNFTHHRILGAVSVYLLIGLIWSKAYHLVFLGDSNAFVFPHLQANEEIVYTRFVYFSYETLTTLGFGDIIPINPIAKSLVMIEGLTGQLFPAIMITRLVSLEIEARKNRNN
ncbi:MAG TPA: potassium channel family protein [Cyclobacteriaceae bacterium]|jgi:voltage-gated potassium channel Kch|nr:hypothetical protein [Cytophagales bacterium]HNP76734.1 potassium channel family protein [Cyclobacteriaceae bacterium]HQQ82188.1 potassium channel family protein [Cyclobacteriaceae bacterium]